MERKFNISLTSEEELDTDVGSVLFLTFNIERLRPVDESFGFLFRDVGRGNFKAVSARSEE
jgi:hypothetical protein